MPDVFEEKKENTAAEKRTKPETAAEKKLEPKKNPKPEKKPAPEKGFAVTASQFIKAMQYRWEQCAGFVFYATIKYGKQCRKPVVEWTELMEAWLAQPADKPIDKED